MNNKILLITQRKVLPKTDGALVYTYGLIQLLHQLNFDVSLVSFIFDKDYSESEREDLLKYVSNIDSCKLVFQSTALNLSFKYPNSIRKYTRSNFKKLLIKKYTNQHFDAVIIDHLQMFEYSKLFPNTRIILHTHNVESNLWFEYAKKCRFVKKALVSLNAKRLFKYEKRALSKADAVTAISDGDASFFKKMCLSANVHVLSAYSEFPLVKTQKDFDANNNNILFIGSYSWYPNESAALFLITQIMPRLRKLVRGIKLTLVGKDPTESMAKNSKDYTDIELTGKVDSVDEYIKSADVFVNSVSEGSGINIKNIEALAKGIPLITSEFGARGYNLIDGENCLIYHDIDGAIQCILKVLNNKKYALELSKKGRASYEEYNKPSIDIRKVFVNV